MDIFFRKLTLILSIYLYIYGIFELYTFCIAVVAENFPIVGQ